MQYELHVNLQQRAILKAAISFWEDKAVKNKIKEFFKSCEELQYYEVDTEWCKLTKTILDEWNENILPQCLKVELIYIVKTIGQKIYDWYNYIKDENKSQYGAKEEIVNYLDGMYWTSYGSVDEIKTLKVFWLENPKLNIAKVYNISCSYVLEDHINDLWHKIPKDIQDNSYNDLNKNVDRLILAYWKYCRNGDLSTLMSYFEEAASNFNRENSHTFMFPYDSNLSIQDNMFRLSVNQGYYIAAKYFWNKLSEEEKERNILKCARLAISGFYYYDMEDRSKSGYKMEKYVEICIFLINHMTTVHKKLFFNEDITFKLLKLNYFETSDVKDEILIMLLETWPWQELFITVLEDMLQYQDENSKMRCLFLDAITNEMTMDHKQGYLKTNKYKHLLRQVWLMLPGFIKQKLVQKDNIRNIFIKNLLNIRDMDSLKLILTDPDIASVKNQFIKLGYDSYQQLILDDQFEILDQFIEIIFRSEEEKKLFKQGLTPNCLIDIRVNYVDKFVYLADKLVNWQCDTPEEKQSFKRNVFPIEICLQFISLQRYDVIDEYINWKFENEEERKKCKDDFKRSEFRLSQLFRIWTSNYSNIDKAKAKSMEYLHWFLESEEKIARFKRKQVFKIKENKFNIFCRKKLYECWNNHNFLS